MTIVIADGRGALRQWDTGRRVKIVGGADVKQIHYQNQCFGCSVDVDVEDDGTAIIPDELLQDYHRLTAYAYATDDTGACTMVQQDFAVYKRAKPADYVYTQTEHAGFDRLRAEIGDLADLTTEAKDTLVAAINEVESMGGRMALRVADGYIQYSTDSGSTWQNLIALAELKGAGMDITGATVGQIAKITAVDASGVPTAWSPADMPSGGSPDAVLYTQQTLTDAQKKQARHNIDAAGEFVVNANALNGSEVTVDKTYAQISEAIKAGKTPSVHLLHRVGPVYLRLFSYYENQPITFSTSGEGEKYPYMLSLVMTEDGSTDIVVDRLVEIAEDGTMRQVRMDGDPYSDMEIATKQYVDNHAASDAVLYTAQSLTDAQKKQARENVDAASYFVVNGTVNSSMEVTMDKTFAQIQAAIHEGKQPVAKLSAQGITFYLSLAVDNGTIMAFYAITQADEYFNTFVYLTLTSTGDASIVMQNSVSVSDSGEIQQVNMNFNPISDMQIATKKYVDDALAAIVDGTEVAY